ncbi:unnamed protein product [Cercopithifilaria johnstoni]|uniref:RING-type domain-containing protein n=1 Tax=Cercopithifilaria johnstoni TaxID=2874296 RepID=A0A8J2MSA2_9BILA|nr:unnamed protein product [Cercopithifilaria johnstoni]
MGLDGCEGQALNGFPSNNECEHAICIDCLDKMLAECETNGSPPICPNILCHQSYAIDSIIALKAFFPQRAKYFEHFALENQSYFLIKDDSISKSEISPDFTVSSRRMEVKCELQGPDESNQTTVIFDQKGNVADFIREMRRALKLLPLDKVYGYYIRREDDKSMEKSDDQKPEELVVDAKSVNRSISELNLTSDSIVIIDTSGIVQMKKI